MSQMSQPVNGPVYPGYVNLKLENGRLDRSTIRRSSPISLGVSERRQDFETTVTFTELYSLTIDRFTNTSTMASSRLEILNDGGEFHNPCVW